MNITKSDNLFLKETIALHSIRKIIVSFYITKLVTISLQFCVGSLPTATIWNAYC